METSGSEQFANAAADPPSDALPKHTMIGEFEIIGLIGEGGFGTVYLAIDHSLQRKVALKEYRPSLLATRHGKSVMVRSTRHADAFEAGLKSFMNEARTLARFDHPALIHVYRVWQQNNTAYMAMPLCEGKSLTMTIRDNPGIATQTWLTSVTMPLIEAVSTLHSSHIYHRDIAPDNIVIQDNGAPMLLDFGAARQIATDRTQALTVMVKPGYAPIEQFADDPSMKQGPWTDIYALGATLYFAITGKAPPNSVARLADDAMPALSRTAAGSYSREFLDAIDRALAVRPQQRPQSIAEFRALLERIPEAVVPRTVMPGTSSIGPAVALSGTAASPVSPGSIDGRDASALMFEPMQTMPPPDSASRSGSSTKASSAKASRGNASGTNASGANASGANASGANASSATAPRAAAAMAGVLRAVDALQDRMASMARSVVTTVGPVVRTKRGMQAIAGGAALVVLVLAMTLVRNPFVQSEPKPAVDSGAPMTVEQPPAETAVQTPVASPAPAASASPVAATGPSVSAPVESPGSPPAVPGQTAVPSAPADTAPTVSTSGTVAFAIRPWGDVVVNGESKGPSPPLKRIALPEGSYRIEITNPGFPSFATDVQVSRNKSVTVSHQFK